jgi:hypothetical protein
VKDVFPESMDAKAIEKVIREAYRSSTQIGAPQNTTVLLRGTAAYGNNKITVYMYYNKVTKLIETALPK